MTLVGSRCILVHVQSTDIITASPSALAKVFWGRYFELTGAHELGPTFTRVAEELHRQYVMGFTPEVLDGKVHKLEVKTTVPGMTVRARQSYLANPELPEPVAVSLDEASRK